MPTSLPPIRPIELAEIREKSNTLKANWKKEKDLIARIRAHIQGFEQRAAAGDPLFASLVNQGHTHNMRTTLVFLESKHELLQAMITT